jgi:hypothetical protein
MRGLCMLHKIEDTEELQSHSTRRRLSHECREIVSLVFLEYEGLRILGRGCNLPRIQPFLFGLSHPSSFL